LSVEQPVTTVIYQNQKKKFKKLKRRNRPITELEGDQEKQLSPQHAALLHAAGRFAEIK
jgi:hypothetical protein